MGSEDLDWYRNLPDRPDRYPFDEGTDRLLPKETVMAGITALVYAVSLSFELAVFGLAFSSDRLVELGVFCGGTFLLVLVVCLGYVGYTSWKD